MLKTDGGYRTPDGRFTILSKGSGGPYGTRFWFVTDALGKLPPVEDVPPANAYRYHGLRGARYVIERQLREEREAAEFAKAAKEPTLAPAPEPVHDSYFAEYMPRRRRSATT